MTGADIQAKLAPYISGSALSLGTPNDLGSDALDAALAGFFGGTLKATLGTPQVLADRVVYAGSTLATAGFTLYAKAPTVPATVTVYADGAQTLQLIVAAQMPAKYALADSFATVAAGSPLAALTLSGTTYTVDSGVSTGAAAFASGVDTGTGLLELAEWIFGGKPPTLAGTVAVKTVGGSAFPVLALAGPPVSSPSVSGFELVVKLQAWSTPAPPTGDTAPPLLGGVEISTELVTPALTVPILISLSASKKLLPIRLDTSRGVPKITALSQLTGFAGGSDPSGLVPSDVKLGTLSLDSASVVLDVENRAFTQLQFQIGLGTDWAIIDNLLTLKGLTAAFAIPNPQDPKSVSVTLTAEFVLASGTLDAFVVLPDKVVGAQLAAGTQISINDLIGYFAHGVSLPGGGDLAITLFDIRADIGNKAYSLAFEVDGNLTIGSAFELDQLSFAVDYSDGALQQVAFGAIFAIAGTELYLAAVYAGGGWTLAGGTYQPASINLSALVTDLLKIFNVSLPTTLPAIVLTDLELTHYSTLDKSFAFQAEIDYFGGDDALLKKITGKVNVASADGSKWTGGVAGSLEIGSNIFTVAYDFAASQTLSASWAATGTETFGIQSLCELLGAPVPDIPEGLDLGLVSASFSYDITDKTVVLAAQSRNYGSAVFVAQKPAAGWRFFLGLGVKPTLDLTNLPLLSKVLGPDETVKIDGIQIVVTSAALDTTAAGQINKLVQALPAPPSTATAYPQVPAAGLAAGGGISMSFHAGSFNETFSLTTGTPPSDTVALPAGGSTALPASGTGTALTAPGTSVTAQTGGPTSAKSSDGTMWYNLQKTFGPVTFQKVGIRYKSGSDGEPGVLFVLMNAGLDVGGLTIAVLGLGVGSPLTTFQPTFNIDGLVVAMQEGPVKVSGGMLGTLDPVNFYGELVLGFSEFSISALAGYAQYQGHPSFFLYAVLNAPLGGPSFFFVTGLAAGMGYNRKLVIPDIGGVAAFPLVAWARGTGGPGMDPGGDVGEQVAKVMGTLSDSGVIAPSVGDYWLALGLRFTSFELVDTFALLTATFGTRFEIDLLGVSLLALPPAVTPSVVRVELAIKASFAPDEGVLSIQGQLTPNSYVLDPACHLTGGFAFFVWFAGEYEGDFVVTLGGYNPHFTVPSHYPVVPRLGLSWQVVPELSISGEMYFALTSNVVMAGGKLSAVWQSGPVRAWFTLWADFLMVFKPFHYYIDAGIDLGASFSIKILFVRISFTIHLGVSVEVWGPPFAGKATVHLSIISFTISFGSGGQQVDTALSWKDFVTQLIPSQQPAPPKAAPPRLSRAMMAMALAAPAPLAAADPTPAVVQINVSRGLIRSLDAVAGQPWFLVSGQEFQGQVTVAIPVKTATFAGHVSLAPDAQQPVDDQGKVIVPNTSFAAGASTLSAADFQPNLDLRIDTVEIAELEAVRLLRNAPKAMWESKSFQNGVPQVDPGTALTDSTLPNTLHGFYVLPVAPAPKPTLPIPLETLEYTLDENIQPFAWSAPTVPAPGSFGGRTVATTITDPVVAGARGGILGALAALGLPVDTQVVVASLANPSRNDLMAAPQLAQLGEVPTASDAP